MATVLCIFETVLRILGQHAHDQFADLLGQRRIKLSWRRWRELPLLGHDLKGRLADEGFFTRQRQVGGHAERIDIGAAIELAPHTLFGAHVRRRAHRQTDRGQIRRVVARDVLGQAEVGDFGGALKGDKNIVRLDVAMNNTRGADVGEASEALH